MAKKEGRTEGKSKSPKTNYRMVLTSTLRANPLNEILFGTNNTRDDELRASLKKNGFLPQYPLTVFKNKTIGCGHRRWRIAHELMIKRVPAVYKAIPPDSDEAQQIMIEDNIYRPNQYRRFSDLELYMFSLKLDSIERKRGGDRRSEQFIASSKEDDKNRAVDQLSDVVGVSPRYLSMISVVTRKIIDNVSKSHPEIKEHTNLYDQIKAAIDGDFDKGLTALAKGEVKVYKMYSKYKDTRDETVSPGESSHKRQEEIFFNSVVRSLKYCRSKLSPDVFSEALRILSEPPGDAIAQLEMTHRAIGLVIERAKAPKVKETRQQLSLLADS